MEELAPGFRFFPTEEELVSFYLNRKLQINQSSNHDQLHRVIPECNIYELEPWQLPQYAGELCRRDLEQWFFFVPQQNREAQGGRPNRTTASGYWKATGSPGYVYSSSNRAIGVKKTMVFYIGKAPTGRKTKWKMNEYRAIVDDDAAADSSSASAPIPKLRSEYSICRVYVISGNFRAFDRRPPGSTAELQGNVHGGQVVLENGPNMPPQNNPAAEETVGADTEEATDEPDMDCLAQFQFSWEQMDWL